MIVYSMLLALALALVSPRLLISKRYREGLAERLGFIPAKLRAAISGKRVVWLHAVSVGEVFAAARLVAELGDTLGNAWIVLISTTTATGQKVARERFGAERVFYYPLDLAWIVRRYLRALEPELLVLMESELWPRMLVECERAGIPVAVANARVSDRSFPRYLRLRALWRPLLRKVRLFLAQGAETAERLKAIGAPADRVHVSGNLKYELPHTELTYMARRIAQARGASRLIIAGSTHEGEETMLLNAWPQILRGGPDFVMIVAPRHPQRFEQVWSEMQCSGYSCVRCSGWVETDMQLSGGTIMLMDTLGDLASVYSAATVAFIGGSLVPKGGHNPLEAARFGKPIVMGNSYENFREIIEGMGTIWLTTEERLGEALISATRNNQSYGKRGREFYKRQSGATRRTVNALLELVR